jgi:short-subunit dehydrogenase
MDLRDANVLLTGGSRGLGPHIARGLLTKGAKVVLTARSEEDLARVRSALGGHRVAVTPGDVTVSEDRRRIVADAEAAFGPIDVLVNNAGVEHIRRLVDLREEEIHETIAVNLESMIQMTRLVLPSMLERRRGHVMHMSSLAGKTVVPFNTVYAATKHAMVGFSLSLRAELRGSGVEVSVACPGWVVSEGVFSHRVHQHVPRASGAGTTTEEVVEAVVRLIERNRPEAVVSGALPRISDIVMALSPRAYEAIAWRTGAYQELRKEAEAQASGEDRG